MTTTRSTRARFAAGILALALIGAACGGDDDDTSSDTGDETADLSALGEENPATGDPVTIGLITEGGDEAIGSQSALAEQGAEIAVEYVNDHLGGIGGRPVELFVCGNGATPAGAQDCANQMVEKGVVAVTMPFTGFGAAQAPIITGAGIPYVTGSANSPEEFSAPNAFALTGGFPGTLGAFAAHAAEQEFEKVGMIVIDVPSATQAAQQLGGLVYGTAGVGYEVITAAPGSPDLTPQLQAAIDGGADALAVTGDVTFCTSFLQAYQTLGLDVPKYLIATCVDQTIIESLGTVLAGSFLATTVGDDNDDAELYAALLEKYAADEDIDPDPVISTGVSAGVGAVISFVRALDGLTGDVTAATVLAALDGAADVPLFLGGGLTYTCDGTAIPMLPNVCSAEFQVGTLDEEGQVTDATTVDASELFVMPTG
ncbi:MAG: ABC transporter substrate-binding protein [Actinomycetota bacterium]|nr:ABC transporter substrate-binding protein [Actinomycetota bacterium]